VASDAFVEMKDHRNLRADVHADSFIAALFMRDPLTTVACLQACEQ
jgi:hypothetical protein